MRARNFQLLKTFNEEKVSYSITSIVFGNVWLKKPGKKLWTNICETLENNNVYAGERNISYAASQLSESVFCKLTAALMSMILTLGLMQTKIAG